MKNPLTLLLLLSPRTASRLDQEHFFMRSLLLLITFLCSFVLSGSLSAQIINFESMGGLAGGDDTEISDRFQNSHGVRFRLDTKGNGLPGVHFPRVEATGKDGTDAFLGFLGNDLVGLESRDRLGNFFLRSHLSRDAGATAPLSLIIIYDDPVSAASAEIWDIDGSTGAEQWQIDAMGADYVSSNDVTDVVDSVLSPLGNTSLLNGKPWTFSFDHRGNADIHAIRIQFVGSKTSSIGFGFDNFSPSSPAEVEEICATGLPPKRSTRYDNTNAKVVAFDHQPQFNASIETTIEGWVYREGGAGRVEAIVSQDLDSGLCFGFFPNLRFYRSGGLQATIPVTAPAGRWTHVAVTYDGSTARFYMDGVLVGERALGNSGTGGAQRLFLGGEAGGLPLLGCLDEVRIWSVVRTEGQIRNGMYEELRNSTGLEAAFPEGGMYEAISGARGNPSSEPETKVWGMLPNNLVVPRVDSVTFDGRPITATEYAGAEEMPIRYEDGPDGHAWLVYTDNEGDAEDKLYVGLTNLREPANGSNRAVSDLAVYLDRGRMRREVIGIQDYRFRMSMDLSDQPDEEFIGNGFSSWRGVSGPNFNEVLLANSYRVKTWIPTGQDLAPPQFEFKIGKPLIGDFESPAGLALSHSNAEHFFDMDMAPGFAHPSYPTTWSCLTFGDAADRPTVRTHVAVGVKDGLEGENMAGYQVWVNDAETGEEYARFRTSLLSNGSLRSKNFRMPADRPFRIRVAECTGCKYDDPIVNVPGIQPTHTTALEAFYDGLPEGNANLANITFHVELPLPPTVFTSIEQSEAITPTVMRIEPDLKVVPELSTITLHGEHFHSRLEVYLHDCLNLVPLEGQCREGIDLILCEVLSISDDQTSMVVKVPPARPGEWSVAIKDNWIRPGVSLSWERWSRRGPLRLTKDLNFAQLYGFEFRNKADDRELDGQSWPLFASVFQDSIYPPLVGCAPGPMYLTYYGVFSIVDRNINGTCVGLASSSRLFLHGDLDSNDFGAFYPFGIPGVPEIRDNVQTFIPPQPDRYRVSGFCPEFSPRNLWGHLRRNHMVQLSHEAISAMYDQSEGRVILKRGGNPREVFNRLLIDKNYVISMLRDGGGHAVTPFTVHMANQVSSDSCTITPDSTPVSWDSEIPRYRAIEIYDNNFPGQKRYIGIDWELNEFFYDRGSDDYTGKPIYTLPLSIWRNSRTRPRIIRDGIEILYQIIVGDADVEHEDDSGNKWGWGEGGKFQEKYKDAKTLFLMDGLEDQTRNALFFPPPGTVPAVTRIRGGGGEYCLHADQGSVMVQLHANSSPGEIQAINLATNTADKLCGLRIATPTALTGVRACLAKEFSASEEVAFDLSGMNLGGKSPLVIELVDGTRAIEVRNEAAEAITYDLKVNAADHGAGVSSNRYYGQVTVPAKSVQTISLSDWPQNASLQAATDLDEDGEPDTTVIIEALPAPELQISRSGTDVKVAWDHVPGTTLMQSTDLSEWFPAKGVMLEDGAASYSTDVQESGEKTYFRLVN